MLPRGGAARVPGPGRPYAEGGSREREAHYHVGRRGVTVVVVPESRPKSFSLRSGEVSARLTPSGDSRWLRPLGPEPVRARLEA